MSLEQALEANTKALIALTAAFAGGLFSKPVNDGPLPPSTPPANPAAATTPTGAAPPIDYTSLRTAFLTLAEKSPQHFQKAAQLLTEFGADAKEPNLKSIDPKQHAALFAAIKAATV